MSIVGLDLSLTATGYASATRVATIKTATRGTHRLLELRAKILQLVIGDVADLVVIEDYAFHGQGAHSHELGELGGVIRLALFEAHIEFVTVIPSTLKKFATGKGNASKEEMLVAAVRAGAPVSTNNEADAWWLRAAGCQHYGEPLVSRPKVQRDALNKVAWPARDLLAVHG